MIAKKVGSSPKASVILEGIKRSGVRTEVKKIHRINATGEEQLRRIQGSYIKVIARIRLAL